MTEEEWLTSDYPDPMVALLRESNVNERKLRLFACANCRQIAYLAVAEGTTAIEIAERYADGDASLEELNAARQALEPHLGGEGPEYSPWVVTSHDAGLSAAHVAWSVPSCEARAIEISIEASGPADYLGTPEEAYAKVKAHSVALLRDIFGNPFCPVSLKPEWLTPTVVQLARGIYEERAFDRLPILADALQDAGCDNDDVLSHCRGPGPHVRGCWVVDLVLGKS